MQEEQHEESDDSWHVSAHDALKRVQQHQASPELLPRYVAAEEDAGALQSKVQELEEGRVRLQEHCNVLQAADQSSRRALRRCEAARQAADDRAFVKAEERRAHVTELVVSANKRRRACRAQSCRHDRDVACRASAKQDICRPAGVDLYVALPLMSAAPTSSNLLYLLPPAPQHAGAVPAVT